MTTPQGAHLVGSINLPTASTTMRAAARILGGHLKRIPDGEVGERFHWIAFQPGRLAATPGLERVAGEPILLRDMDMRKLRISDGVDPASLRLPPLGYAEAALNSWEVFRELQEAGEIPADTRFQVSLPTAVAVVGAYIVPEHRVAFEPIYEAALFAELTAIVAGIPHDRLAIQWDTAVEFALIESGGYGNAYLAWFDDIWQGVLDRAVRQAEQVPVDVELGYHFCYGDAGEKHFVEPEDTGNLVAFAQLLLVASPRHIDWIHLPVPIERDDDDYFEPLGRLEPGTTEIYLGLVHREDGVEGANRRIAAAQRHLEAFGVATECGCGRAPEEAMLPLLETHRAVAAPW